YPVLIHRVMPSLSLPSDLASRRRLCESLVLLLHQDGQRTYTSERSNMLGTPKKSPANPKTDRA
ncbi:MAG: hypothetical protein ACYTF1_05125, partial [Planctomycetota bacterium]